LSSKRSSHRHLQSIDSAWLLPETKTSLETGATGPGGGTVSKPWDQFETNRRLFAVPDTFDEKYYTKALDHGAITKEQREYAEKVASLIEKTSTSNPHLKEERGQISEKEEGEDDWNEEDRYSGVRREEAPLAIVREEGEAFVEGKELELPVSQSSEPIESTKPTLQIDTQDHLSHELQIKEEEPAHRSIALQTPTLLRATALEFIPTPTLKTERLGKSPGLPPQIVSPRDPSSLSSKTVNERTKSKTRKSKDSPSRPVPPPAERPSSAHIPVTPNSSDSATDLNQFPPPQAQGPPVPYPFHQFPPHYPLQPHMPTMAPSQGGGGGGQQYQHQQMYLQPHPQMNGQMFPFGMPPPMFTGPPMLFPMGGPPFPMHPYPGAPPYGFPPPQMSLPMHFPSGHGQYPMPGPAQFYVPPSFPAHFVPHHYPPPHGYPSEPIPVAAALGEVYQTPPR
jgi:hypothetical protein